jgi:NAD(P)-dependent dehydrogenase (short-subunit alcohol dehydrogenase family)
VRRLEGRGAIVTGGAGGIGAATARRLAAEGARVVVADIEHAQAESVALELDGHAVACDVRSEDDVAAAVDAADGHLGGRIDILVNVAGIEQRSSYDTATVQEWDRILDVNLRSAWLFAKHVGPRMVARGSGSIVNVSSTNGLVGSLAGVAYGASKGGMVILTKDLAVELVRTGVRVNVVCPGTIDTPLMRRWIEASDDRDKATRLLERSMPIGRMGTPEEVAAAIAFLASDDASLCTGAVLAVDGGLTAQ